MMTLKQKFDAIQKIGTDIQVPFNHWRLLGTASHTLDIAGDQISLGEDFASLQDAQNAIAWYAEQLGGKVKWEK